MSSARWVGGVALAGLFVVAVLARTGCDVGAPTSGDPAAEAAVPAVPGHAVVPGREFLGGEPPLNRTTAASAEAAGMAFVIEIVDEAGEPAPGQIALLESPRAPLFSGGANFDAAALDRRIRVQEHSGRVEWSRRRGCWLSVAARGIAGLGRGLVPPEDHSGNLRLELSKSRRSALVMVVESDLETLVTDGELRVLRALGDAGIEEVPVAIADSGITEVSLDSARSVTVIAPGATPADGEPFAAIVHAPKPPLPHQQFVTVVVPGPRVDVDVELEIDGYVAKHGVLVLRRVDDGSFREVPWPEPLREGRQTARLRVDEGDYMVATWPVGHLVLDRGDALVRARAPKADVRLRLLATTDRKPLRLHGIELWKFPVHVQLQDCDGILSSRPGASFIGSWTWRTPEQEIALVDGAHWVVAQGPQGVWISASAWTGGTPAVQMRPATLTCVAWQPTERGVERAWLEMQSPMGNQVVPLRRAVTIVQGGRGPGFEGSCYLPLEPFEVTCMAERSGKVEPVWSRRVEPKSLRSAVEVAGDD